MPLLTDDLDFNHNELDVYPGGNGDWYISIKTDKGETHAVRVSMSGGIALTEVKLAVANLYRAMKKAGLSD